MFQDPYEWVMETLDKGTMVTVAGLLLCDGERVFPHVGKLLAHADVAWHVLADCSKCAKPKSAIYSRYIAPIDTEIANAVRSLLSKEEPSIQIILSSQPDSSILGSSEGRNGMLSLPKIL